MTGLTDSRWRRWQALACLVGVAAGWLPSLSWTRAFWEFQGSQFGKAPVRVDRVAAGSPAEAAGLRIGDRFLEPKSFDDLYKLLDNLSPGETLACLLDRDGEQLPLTLRGQNPQIAAIWYASAWYPLGGLIAAILGLFLFATGPRYPIPIWQSVAVAAGGIVLAVGFTVTCFRENAFSRVRLYQQWLMGAGDDWSWGQAYWGLAAAISLTLTATLEIRARLEDVYQPSSD